MKTFTFASTLFGMIFLLSAPVSAETPSKGVGQLIRADVCETLLNLSAEGGHFGLPITLPRERTFSEKLIGRPLPPPFVPVIDRWLTDIPKYREIIPDEVVIVRPPIRPPDKFVLESSEFHKTEDSYIAIYFRDGSPPLTTKLFGSEGRFAVKIGFSLYQTMRLLLQAEREGRFDRISLIVDVHTHPYAAAYDSGFSPDPPAFSDADLYGSNYIKMYLEAFGIHVPMQFEIVFSKITETLRGEDAGTVQKLGMHYPARMTTTEDAIQTSKAKYAGKRFRAFRESLSKQTLRDRLQDQLVRDEAYMIENGIAIPKCE